MFMISYLIAANLFQSTMSRLQGAFIAGFFVACATAGGQITAAGSPRLILNAILSPS